VADKPNWINLSSSQRDELDGFVHAPGYRVVVRNELPSVFPERFRAKIDSALIIAAPTSTGGTYLAFSANRVDLKARALDIELFGVILHSTGAGPSGVFIHHGTWNDRTQYPPDAFWTGVLQSGVAQYVLASPPASRSAGPLTDLPRGHAGSFEAIVQQIRAHEEGVIEQPNTRSTGPLAPMRSPRPVNVSVRWAMTRGGTQQK